ncbi:MAG TPA: aldo/keto reductase [Thermoanaerobaculia bacterium]|nr:aldo/keto reductase [Thermoanaerobaculia bacterium]
MSRKKKEAPEAGLSRRDLLRTTAIGTAGTVLAAGGSEAASAPRPAMRYRPLGKTGLRVSEVGFGGYPVDDPDVVRYAVDQGITYFDTSHCYRGGRSEEVIGEGLQGRRDRVVLATKWCPHHVGKPAVKKSFLDILDRSLKRLRTDYVDVLLNHEVGERSDGEGVRRLQNLEMWEAWEAARKAGKARFLGVSGHDPDLMEVLGHAVGTGKLSVLLGRYSFLDYPKQNELIVRAHQKGVAFVAMKTLAGAKGADLDRFRGRQTSFKQAALKWVLSNARLSNLIISMNSRRQVDEYAGASGQKLAAADHEVLEEYASRFSQEVCRFDGACHDACPGGVRIADILRFSMYCHEYEQEGRAMESYAKLVASERAAHCAHCAGFCEQACSYDLPVRTLLIKAHGALGEPPREG